VINVVATDVTINYLSAHAAANIAAAPPNEYTLHAERLPIVSLCLTPDLDPQSTLLLAQALIDKGAIVPPELLPDLTPDWFPQHVIDLLSHTAAAAAAAAAADDDDDDDDDADADAADVSVSPRPNGSGVSASPRAGGVGAGAKPPRTRRQPRLAAPTCAGQRL
jgi:hypothetical protein